MAVNRITTAMFNITGKASMVHQFYILTIRLQYFFSIILLILLFVQNACIWTLEAIRLKMYSNMDKLRIGSFNVRGISSFAKRCKIFHYIHQKEFDIVLLQKTHSSKSTSKLWNSQFRGRIYFAHGSSNARGVCIAIRKKANVKIHREYKDDEGRILILDIEFDQFHFSLGNIYAPNLDDVEFFAKVRNMFNSTNNVVRIVGGDFNMVLDIGKDKIGGRPITKRQQT